MSKPYSSLPEALKGIVFQMGINILEDIKLINILSDLYTLEEIPAAKAILKIIASEGYGTEIISSLESPSWDVKRKLLTAKIVTQNGYKENLASFVLDSIYYALGKIESEPSYAITSDKTNKTLVDLEIELRKLKGEYIRFLEENVVELDNSPAYFETNDKSDIYEYREKILILSKALGKDDANWCQERLNEIIKKYSHTPSKSPKKGFFKRLFG